MFDLFGWFRKRIADAFTGGIADGMRQVGIAPADMPAELAAMHRANAPALAAKDDGEAEAEPRKAGRGK